MQPADVVEANSVPGLPPRPADGHKGTFGRVLVVAGSRGMSGAAVLCGTAAVRGGAGLVRVATPRECWPPVAAGFPCYTTLPLPVDEDGEPNGDGAAAALEAAQEADALAVGPGLGQSEGVRYLVHELLTRCDRPLVLDADGINALADPSQSRVRTEFLRDRKAATVITPHPGEFARLTGRGVPADADRVAAAVAAAREWECVVLLKGSGTLVTDGKRVYRNSTGNSGMATGGTGDVLTGLIAALLARDLDPFDAARLGAHLHGLAGDLARDDLGEEALSAVDLPAYFGKAFRALRSR